MTGSQDTPTAPQVDQADAQGPQPAPESADNAVPTPDPDTAGVDQERELTRGERLVGLKFNPAGNEKVNKLKQLYAEAADLLYDLETTDSMQIGIVKHALDQTLDAQMSAVKAVTWGL